MSAKEMTMPTPRTKNELLKKMSDEFAKLLSIIERTPSEILERDFWNILPNNCRDKNARDVLIHLYEWHKMLERFIANNLEASKAGFKDRFSTKSEIMPFLPPPYNWRTYPTLNMKIWQSHQNTSLKSALEKLKQSHSAIVKQTLGFSNNELFDKWHFAFTGNNTLGSYVISSTSSHYAWAIKQLKSGLKNKMP